MGNNVDKPIVLFVVGILGVIFVGIIAGIINEDTSKVFVFNESVTLVRGGVTPGNISTVTTYTLTNSNTGSDLWKQGYSDCAITGFVFKNQSGHAVAASAYTLDSTAGTFTLANVVPLNTSGSNATAIDYNYCPDDYQHSSFGRNSLKIVAGMLALFVLVGAVTILYSLIKEK